MKLFFSCIPITAVICKFTFETPKFWIQKDSLNFLTSMCVCMCMHY